MDDIGGYLGVVVPNGPNAVHWYQIPRRDRELRPCGGAAQVGVHAYVVCVCHEMGWHVGTAVTAERG